VRRVSVIGGSGAWAGTAAEIATNAAIVSRVLCRHHARAYAPVTMQTIGICPKERERGGPITAERCIGARSGSSHSSLALVDIRPIA
jgi:hypothetical protein